MCDDVRFVLDCGYDGSWRLIDCGPFQSLFLFLSGGGLFFLCDANGLLSAALFATASTLA